MHKQLIFLSILFAVSWAAHLVHAPSNRAIQGQYIVVFKHGTTLSQRSGHLSQVRQQLQSNLDSSLLYEYAIHDFNGYAIQANSRILNWIMSSRVVDFVEQDQHVEIGTCTTESSPPNWGLDRIDQKALPLNNAYQYTVETGGSGVTAYVIDTGIDVTNPEFGGRASWGPTYPTNSAQISQDCNGHGTHVAGIIGSNTYGVAKKVTLVAVKVLDCNGSGAISDVIAGVNWVASNADKQRSVANMSLGGSRSSSLDSAVSNAISAGIVFAVAAGNSNADACTQSPADVGSALTVGATTNSDARASYSNWGTCVDVFAPGSNIVSTWLNNGTRSLSGTSMATPHVTGVAAILRSADTVATGSTIASRLKTQATGSVVNLNCPVYYFRCFQTTRSLLYSSCS